MTEQKRYKKKWFFAILIVVAALILVFFVILPLIIVGPKRLPDNNEITTRFSEFLINPEGLKGIEARTEEGYALFKYYSNTKDSFEAIEQQAIDKGWIKTEKDNARLAFQREKQISEKLKIHQYEFVRILRSQLPNLICVGYDRFLSQDRVIDIKNSDDMKVIENTTWRKLKECAAGSR